MESVGPWGVCCKVITLKPITQLTCKGPLINCFCESQSRGTSHDAQKDQQQGRNACDRDQANRSAMNTADARGWGVERRSYLVKRRSLAVRISGGPSVALGGPSSVSGNGSYLFLSLDWSVA